MSTSAFITIFIIISGVGVIKSHLSETEVMLTFALMNKMNLRQWILVEESKTSNISFIKKSAQQHKPVSYQPVNEFSEYFKKEAFPNEQTLIVLNLNLDFIIKFLTDLKIRGKDFFLSKFKWLIFTSSEELAEAEEKMFIRYDSEFIFAYRQNSTTYALVEKYNVKNGMISKEFGLWNGSYGLTTTNVFFYWRRLNVNGTKFIINFTTNRRGLSNRTVALESVILDMGKIMNFRFEWAEIEHKYPFQLTGDMLKLAYPYHADFRAKATVGPVLKIKFNFYISNPIAKERADYYQRPFTKLIWGTLLLFIILGSTILTSMRNFDKKQSKMYGETLNDIFLAFDCLCNQTSARKNFCSISFKMVFFTLRFLALFITALYSATLLSYMAVQYPQIPFQDLEGFVENGKYNAGAPFRSLEDVFVRVSKNPLLKIVRERFYLQIDVRETNTKMCFEKFALIFADYEVNKLSPLCEIFQVDEPISSVFMAVHLVDQSPFAQVFNHLLIQFYTSGIQSKIQNQNLDSRDVATKQTTFNSLDIDQTYQIISIAPIGIILAVNILLIEFIFYKCRKVCRKKFKKRNRKSTILNHIIIYTEN